jgi:Putative restriction endonuclease
MWRTWIPDLTIEVVSPSSGDRDYVEKREEYWTLGVKEYWIVEAAMGKVTQLRRGKADWIAKELHADDFCETKLLPGFKMPCRAIFDVAAGQEDEEQPINPISPPAPPESLSLRSRPICTLAIRSSAA